MKPGRIWTQESIIGSVFEGTYALAEEKIVPSITGIAFVNAESHLILNPDDPFEMGIRS